MKIVFVNGLFPQPSQTFVLNHIAHALAAGHRTMVAALRLQRGVSHPVIDKFSLYPKIVYGSPKNLKLYARAVAGAIRHPAVLRRALRPGAGSRLSSKIILIALQIGAEPDVLIANFGPNGVVAARLKERFFPNAKVVVIFHGYDLTSYVTENGWTPYQRMAPFVDLAVCVNAHGAELIRANTEIRKVVVHHLGVHWKTMPRRRLNDGEQFSILFVGRMTEKKGFDQLLKAVDLLHRQGRAVRVHAIGDGPLLAHYKATVSDLKLDDSVVFHGGRDHQYVLKCMSKCDCLVAPSVTAGNGDREGIPVVLMEAMGCGVPVVATRHSGIPELVVDGESGLLVDERDAPGLAQQIERLMLEPDIARALAAAGRRRVAEHFDAEQQDLALFQMIEALMSPAQQP